MPLTSSTLNPHSWPSEYLNTELVQSTHDLTGQVLKAEPYPFAYGGNADIWKAKWKDQDSTLAVKIIRGPDDSRTRRKLLRETAVWSRVQHPNITPFLGVSLDFDRPRAACLVSPFYSHGDIACYIKKRPSVDKLALITQVTSAISYLHSLSIIHGDIKATNILINDNCEASLADFGMSRILDTTECTTRGSGVFRFMPPELVQICTGEEFNPTTTQGWRWKALELISVSKWGNHCILGSAKATDVWAFAMTAIEIFTGSVPFSHIKRDGGVINHVMSGGRPKREHCGQISDDIWTMLESCWHVDPNQRPPMPCLFTFFSSQATLVAAQRTRM